MKEWHGHTCIVWQLLLPEATSVWQQLHSSVLHYLALFPCPCVQHTVHAALSYHHSWSGCLV